MAITTHERITRGGLEIGVSKLFSELFTDGDLTPQELARFSYAAWEAPEINAFGITEIDISSEQGAAVSTQMSYFQAPMGGDDYVSNYVNSLIPTGRLYAFNVILYTSGNYEFITTDNAENVRLITDIDLASCAMTLRYAPSEDENVSIDYPDARTIKKLDSGASIYYHDDNLLKHWDSVYNTWRTMGNIHPYCIIANDSGILFITHGSYFGGHQITGFGTYAFNLSPINYLQLPYGDNIINQKWSYETNDIKDFTKSKHLLRWIGNDQEYEPQTWASGTKKAAWDYDDNFYIIMEQTNQVYGIANDKYYIYPKNLNIVKRLIACVGLNVYIGDDKSAVIKPIITGGMVVGYSEDASTPSEIDNITNVTGNNISPFPPSPVPPGGDDEDNDDPIPTVGAPYSSGLARYYVTTVGSTILNHISAAMGAWNLKDTGKDLYKNIISCKLIKSPAPIPVSGSEPFTVYGVTLQYEGSDITLPVINDNPTKSFGSYNIPRKFNDFRDYAPYTKVEIYLPYCGWTVLPSHVVGRSVSVTYYTDIIAATCKAVVYCGSNVIAEAAGVIGLDIPMITENAGAKAEAVTMGLLAYGKAGLQTALGVGAAVATKGKAGVKSAVSGLENLVSAYSQTAMAFNQNYTEINGKNGDGCCIAGISAIVIKITRPKYGANTTAPYVPSEYGHATGFVSMKSAKVGSFTGLLVADNVDTSGISGATDREKQLIKLYLESGIYVNHPN